MTRDDIIGMAREVFDVETDSRGRETFSGDNYGVKRFAALVEAAKDAEHQQTLALQQRSYEREIRLEVEAEREACAKLCEDYDDDRGTGETWGPRFADLIRARGNT